MRQYVVDAFTDRVFGGNPAAVCILESWLPDELMMDITRENNLSETAIRRRILSAVRVTATSSPIGPGCSAAATSSPISVRAQRRALHAPCGRARTARR